MSTVYCPRTTCSGILTELDMPEDPLVIAHGFDAVCSSCGRMFVLPDSTRASVLGHTTRSHRRPLIRRRGRR